jgi:putative membrane protein
MRNRVGFVVAFIMIAVPAVWAFSEMKPKPIDTVLSEIRQEQGLKVKDPVKIDKVTPAKLEELGDSVMEVMIGNSELHDQMDKMMGGDGSASLTAMHQRIGFNYLSGYPLGMMNLMSGGMMGFSNNPNFTHGGRFMMNGNFPGMMGNYGWGFGGTVMGLIFLILIGVVIFFAVKIALKGGFKNGGETPLEILKKRYAKGEISKDDFEKMKIDITN